jgi:hypothetical protein
MYNRFCFPLHWKLQFFKLQVKFVFAYLQKLLLIRPNSIANASNSGHTAQQRLNHPGVEFLLLLCSKARQ